MFSGIAPPIITPFEKQGTIDNESLRELVQWWIKQGVHAIVPCGSNGEVVYMDFEERAWVIENTIQYVNGRVPVIAGTGLPGTRQTVKMTQIAEDLGADAALVVTPYYYPTSPKAIINHYQSVAKVVKIPILLYNVPKFTNHKMYTSTISQLSKIDNVRGIKDSSGDFGLVQDVIRTTNDETFDLYAGAGGLLAATLHSGGKGGILALANIAPEKCVQIFEEHQRGELKSAQQTNYDLIELNKAITGEFGIPGLKFALRLRGLPAGLPRRPLQPPTSQGKDRIKTLLREASLL